MIKKIILISLGVIVLVLGGITAYVATMDWNSRKDKIAAEISDMLGEKVEIAGDLEVSVFLHPHISASNISIINPLNSEKLATIEKLETEVSLSSLLKKTPDIKSLSLTGTEIWVNMDDNGKTNWHQTTEPKFFNADIESRLQSFNLQNAVLHFTYDKYDIHADLVNFNADIQAASLAGPYRLDGNFKKNDDNFGLALSLSNLSQTEDITVNFAITHPRSKSYLRYDGTYNLATDDFKGDFSGSSEKMADFINILMNKDVLEDKYNQPFLFSMVATSDEKQISIEHFAVKLEKIVEGAGDIKILLPDSEDEKPLMEIKYQFVTLDMRPFMAIAKAKFSEFQQGKKYAPDKSFDAVFDINSEHLIVSDQPTGYMDNISAKGTWKDGVLSFDDFYAACQGNIVWTMSGSLSEEQDAPSYYAKVAFEGQNFLSLIKSFDNSLTAPTQSSYRNGKLTFDIYGNDKQTHLSNISLTMDKMKLSADIEISLGKPTYIVKIDVDKINLDNYIARNEEITGIKEIILQDSKDLAWLKDTEIKAQLTAQEMVFRAIPFKNALLNIETGNGILNVIQAKADKLLESNIKLSAVIKGLGTDELSVENAGYEISSNNLSELIKKWEIPHPSWPLFELNNFSSTGTVNGTMKNAEVDVKNTLENIHWNYKGKISQEDNHVQFNGYTSIKAPSFEHFANLLGADFSENNIKSVLNASGNVEGYNKHWKFTDAELQIGFSKYTGNAEITEEQKIYTISGDVKANELNLENVLNIQNSKAPLRKEDLFDDSFITRPSLNKDLINYNIYRNLNFDIGLTAEYAVYKNYNFIQVSTRAINSQNVLQLKDLKFQRDETSYQGQVQIDYAQDPVIKGSLTINNIDMAGLGGNIYKFAEGNLSISGDFNAPATSFDNMVNGISGNMTFNTKSLTVNGINLSIIREDLLKRQYSKGLFQMVRDNLQTGSTIFTDLTGSAELKDGIIEFKNTSLQNENENLSLSGKVSLSDWKMNTLFDVRYKEDIPEFSFSLTGMINKPVLDISVENIVSKYDSHWEQVEKQKQVRQEEELRIRQEKMAQSQKKVTEVADKIASVIPVIENYMQKTTYQGTLAQYQSEMDTLNKISQEINAMQILARQADYTDADINSIEEKCPEFLSTIAEVMAQSHKIYQDDVDERLQEIENSSAQISNNNAELYDDYQKMIQDDFDELMKVDATQYMVNNTDLKTKQGQISDYNNQLIDMYDSLNEKIGAVKNYISEDEKEKEMVDLQQSLEEMRAIYNKMQKVRAETADSLLKIINESKEAHAEKQARIAEELEKEKTENADNLLFLEENSKDIAENKTDTTDASATSDIVSSSRADDIQETKSDGRLLEEATTDTKSTVSGTIKSSYQKIETVKPAATSNYLKPITGDAKKASGTITVK